MRKSFLITTLAVVLLGCSPFHGWYDPVIPVSLVGIQAVNIDNSGEFPIVSVSPIKKEAYMIGVRWITEHTTSEDDFITGPIRQGQRTPDRVSDQFRKRIIAITPFGPSIPAGSNVSSFFKEISRHFLPAGIDEGFVLLVAPTPGEHSFRIEYHKGGELKFYYYTQPVIFY